MIFFPYVSPIAIPDFELVFNLLFYDSFDQSKTDSQLKPGAMGGATAEYGVPVKQFGSPSGGFWVMVTCPAADPTSFSARLALQYFISAKFLSFVNSTFIQDLENLTVGGYFLNGQPLP